ncbi:MAG: exodeoxyribonuclease V subunit alpha [Chitinivibrionales bacterium]
MNVKENHNGTEDFFSPIDKHFARFMCNLQGTQADEFFYAAALASKAGTEGHVCVDLHDIPGTLLTDRTLHQLPSPDTWPKLLKQYETVGTPGDFKPLILDGSRLYLYRFWIAERRIADILIQKAEHNPIPSSQPLSPLLDQLFEAGDRLIWQKTAAISAASRSLCVVTGGPGTGKTTTAANILQVLITLSAPTSLRIACAAPTGKAANRLRESLHKAAAANVPSLSLPTEATTIHRLLGAGAGGFRYTSENPVPADVIVVDEASMIDITLIHQLLEAISPECRLILLGDRFQLASVEPGAVLGDLCPDREVGRFTPEFAEFVSQIAGLEIPSDQSAHPLSDCLIELRTVFRFNENIARVSEQVRNGNPEEVVKIISNDESKRVCLLDFSDHLDTTRTFVETVLPFYESLFEAPTVEALFESLERFRILCALRNGPSGVYAINAAIEKLLYQRKLIHGDSLWYEGKPVMITRNDYNLNLFNGDIGVITRKLTGEESAVFATSKGEYRAISPSRLPSHETAYAMTIHKSQGSEFDHVMLVLPPQESPVLTRELLYTGITRAKSRVDVVGSEDVLRSVVSKSIERTTGLRQKLWGETKGSR